MGSNHHQNAQDNTKSQSCINQQQQQSPTSSPSHEFSFTISLHSNPTNTFLDKNKTNNYNNTPSSFAIDLTPADDIFFHGHLLPLHLLSHLPVSPRSSTNSLDSFTLPITDLLDGQNPTQTTTSASHTNNSKNENTTNTAPWNHHYHHHTVQEQDKNGGEKQHHGRVKSKSFSIFGIPRWKKLSDVREKEEKEKQKMRKLRFDVSHVVKRYMRMVRPLLSFKGGRREDGVEFGYGRQAYSFSSKDNNLSGRKSSNSNRHELKGGVRRGDFFSAPASMRTSPSNSGLLVATTTAPATATATATPLPGNNDSTMEELQAAIQAAIAHCKNSIAMGEQKLKAN